MRILHYIPSVRPEVGGPARAVTDLCRALATRDHEVTLSTCDESGAAVVPSADGKTNRLRHIQLPRLIPGASVFSPAALRSVRNLIQGQDVVHVHGVWLPSNVQICNAARRLGVPYFISVRGMLDDWCMSQKWFKKRLFLVTVGRRWLERAQCVHLTARGELEQAKVNFPKGTGAVCPNLLDLAPYRDLPGPEMAQSKFPVLDNDHPSILFLSRIHEKKRLEALMQAMAILRAEGMNVNLIVAGTGAPSYVEQMKSLPATLGLPHDVVSFVGQVIDELKLSLYQACDVLALPTSQENFGFVFPEALACGTPVVTTKGVDIWEELQEHGGALILDADADSFAKGLRELVLDPERLRTMGARGREWVFQWLDTDRLLDQFEAMYHGSGSTPA